MGDFRNGMQKIADSEVSQQRSCAVCGKQFKTVPLWGDKTAMVADCECEKAVSKADEAEKAVDENLRHACIPSRLIKLDFDTYPSDDADKVAAMERYMRRPVPGLMILVGTVGRGKSGLACGVLKRMAKKGMVRYYYAYDLLNDRVSRDTMEVMREALRPETIVIDEIGLQLKTDAAKEFMERLLIGRHDDMKNTILISNLGSDDFMPLIGPRAWDRAKNDGMLVVFTGKSFRER